MSLFGRRMTPELLAAELLRGLESGEIVFEPPADEPGERERIVLADEAAHLARLCDRLRALAGPRSEPAAGGSPPPGPLDQLRDEIDRVAKRLGAA